MTDNAKKIEELFNKGILINKEMLGADLDNNLLEKIESESDLLVLNDDYTKIVKQQTNLVDWYEIDKFRVNNEKDRDDELYQSQLQTFRQSTLILDDSKGQELSSLEAELDAQDASFSLEGEFSPEDPSLEYSSPPTSENLLADSAVTIVLSYKNIPEKYEIPHFANIFLSRYKFLEKLLRPRRELKSITSIGRLSSKKERESVAVIGIISDIGETKNGNLIVTLEDPTGIIKTIILKNKKELFLAAKDLVVDEVIGISGVSGENIIFVEEIVWPEVPPTNELKYGPDEEYVIFLSDIHVGSTYFLGEEFAKFIKWVNGEAGNESQRLIASKVKYIVIAGDLVDGIGIYPGQENELNIKTMDGQYAEFTRLIKQISVDKKIIMCPGNHDMVHLAEPQPAFYQEFAPGLFDLPNVSLVTNPSIVNIGKKEGFEGFNILLYHGYSFDYYVANVESIRNGGGYKRADLIMKFLLKRRHLAPSFKSTPYFPAHPEDPLLIKLVPDFLITGHIHYSSIANYRGVTMISGSCWQAKTGFQEKLGHEPEPCRVPLVNLKTREIKILRFDK